MAKAGEQLPGPPLQEAVQGVGGAFIHLDLVLVAPDLQPCQSHAHVQGSVELQSGGPGKGIVHTF